MKKRLWSSNVGVLATLVLTFLGSSAHAGAAPPNLNGVWQVASEIKELKTVDGKTPPLTAAAEKVYAANRARWAKGDLAFDPAAKCISPGLPRILYLPYPFEIIQTSRRVHYMFEWNYWNRHIELRDMKLEVPYPLSLGISSGRWDGDTLVVDTIGLRGDNTLLDAAGMPHSQALKLTERIRLVDGGRALETRIRFEDPATFKEPWETVVRFRKLPAGTEIKEDICLDRIDAGKPAIAWESGSR